MRRFIARRSCVCIIVFLASFALPCDEVFAQTRVRIEDREHKVAVNLYLMRNLEQTIETWKPPSDAPVEMGIWVYTTRKRLKAFKLTAEAYKLDEDVIRAYGDVLELLKEYEEFLKEVVLYNLVGNVARPSQQHIFVSVAEQGVDILNAGAAGATIGGPIGGTIGSVYPGVGTVLGGAIGGATGASLGLLYGVGKTALAEIYGYRDSVAHARIDDAVKTATLQRIDILTRHYASTRKPS